MTRSRKELEQENEISRLREELAVLQAREVAPNDMGIAGRVAITRLRDTDWVEFVKAVETLPAIAEREGVEGALAYAHAHLSSMLDAFYFQAERTADLVQQQHRVYQMLDEGEVEVMCLRGHAGQRARTEFLRMAERHFYRPAVRAAFARGTETPAGLMPPGFG